jgi:hypothetical protein
LGIDKWAIVWYNVSVRKRGALQYDDNNLHLRWSCACFWNNLFDFVDIVVVNKNFSKILKTY